MAYWFPLLLFSDLSRKKSNRILFQPVSSFPRPGERGRKANTSIIILISKVYGTLYLLFLQGCDEQRFFRLACLGSLGSKVWEYETTVMFHNTHTVSYRRFCCLDKTEGLLIIRLRGKVGMAYNLFNCFTD